MSAKRTFDLANASSETAEVLESKTTEVKGDVMPLKRYFRSRAHCNPLSHNDGFRYPLSPEAAGIDNPSLLLLRQLLTPICYQLLFRRQDMTST